MSRNWRLQTCLASFPQTVLWIQHSQVMICNVLVVIMFERWHIDSPLEEVWSLERLCTFKYISDCLETALVERMADFMVQNHFFPSEIDSFGAGYFA